MRINEFSPLKGLNAFWKGAQVSKRLDLDPKT